MNTALTPTMQSDTDPAEGVSPRKRAVADAMVTDGLDIKDAVIASGFSEKRTKQTVYELRHDVAWVRYLNHRTVMQTAEEVAKAQHVRGVLMRTSESDKVRLDAARDVMDRGGFKAPDRRVQTGGVTISIDLGEGG